MNYLLFNLDINEKNYNYSILLLTQLRNNKIITIFTDFIYNLNLLVFQQYNIYLLINCLDHIKNILLENSYFNKRNI